MDRRSTLAVLMGKRAVEKSSAVAPTPTGTLQPYTGQWTASEAAHLLRRTTFSASYAEIQEAVDLGLEASVVRLLLDNPMPAPPINYYYEDDPHVPVGETWVDAAFENFPGAQAARRNSLRAWTFGRMMNDKWSVREKMTLFWHNHFVVAETQDPRLEYRYINTLRENALGNFRELTKAITIDPSMLIYLNGRQNTNTAPNENYARELLELFTLGKGDLAGPGDYTTFTEDDVVAIAKVLTGWRFRVVNNGSKADVVMIFNGRLHDDGDKMLSHRFDNAVITNSGDQEYQALIDLIFQRDEPATFIARKLYRWFVYYDIPEIVEAEIIEPLAQIIRDNDYDIKPAMEALLMSEHFYDSEWKGCMIKHPIDFLVGTLNQLEFDKIPDLDENYYFWNAAFRLSGAHGMEYYMHPSVAGWKAYYQEPVFYRFWISSVTLPLRTEYTDLLTEGTVRIGRARLTVDVLAIISQLNNPSEPNDLIRELTSWLFPNPISEDQVDYLKEILIPGLPDFEWTVEYNNHLADPNDANLKRAIENKLRALFKAMLKMPEYYLS